MTTSNEHNNAPAITSEKLDAVIYAYAEWQGWIEHGSGDYFNQLEEQKHNNYLKLRAELLEANTAPAAPKGWKLVPVEPTEAMSIAGGIAWESSLANDVIGPLEDAWAAMLAATPAPAPAQEPTTFTSPVRTPAPPFATFDESGKGCDDRVQDFYHAHSKEVETRAFNRGYDAAKPAQEVGLTDEEKTWAANKLMEQAQVFASAWSLVGGKFDFGNALEEAEQAKTELRSMVVEALRAKGGKHGRSMD